MFDVVEKGISLITRAAALPTNYVEDAISNLDNDELYALVDDIEVLTVKGVWSMRIIEMMKRARMIADADRMMARFEAA